MFSGRIKVLPLIYACLAMIVFLDVGEIAVPPSEKQTSSPIDGK
jgi:hypothetical protein